MRIPRGGPSPLSTTFPIPLPLLALLTILLLLTPTAALRTHECLRTADHAEINRRFTDGGPGTKVFLCPGQTYKLRGTISFTAADQELATDGYPTDERRAVLEVDSASVATAIQGDCRRCARASIRSLTINGGRVRFGRVRDANNAPALVMLGGNEGQRVTDCYIADPRGFSALHIREGDKLQCRGAVIERNAIVGVGEEYIPDIDGPDPETSPLGRPLASGISLACRDSIVRNNVVADCTDTGIVLYCAPGSEVVRNTITAASKSAMGGIMMVDDTPFAGDYAGVRVAENVLNAAAPMRVGIGIGLAVLTDDTETVLRGGFVVGNTLRGTRMGYGIAAAGISGWTISENVNLAKYEGSPSSRCFEDVTNPPPMPFVYHSQSVVKSVMQPEFEDHSFAYIVCIDGVKGPTARRGGMLPNQERFQADNDGAYRPKADRQRQRQGQADRAARDTDADTNTADDTNAIPSTESDTDSSASHSAPASTGYEVLDEILLLSQQRLVDAMNALGDRVLARPALQARPAAAGAGARQKATGMRPIDVQTLTKLETRINAAEQAELGDAVAIRALRVSLRKLRDDLDEMSSWQDETLQRAVAELAERDDEFVYDQDEPRDSGVTGRGGAGSRSGSRSGARAAGAGAGARGRVESSGTAARAESRPDHWDWVDLVACGGAVSGVALVGMWWRDRGRK